MRIDFDKLKNATSKFADGFASTAKDWYGRSVNFFKDLGKSGKIKDPGMGALSIVAAHVVIFQLAYRVSNLLGENSHFQEYRQNRYRAKIGPIAWILYAGGIVCFCNIVTVSLEPLMTFAMHATGFALGLLIAAKTG